MQTSLESGVFCFDKKWQIIATWHFFLGLVRPNFTGRYKIDTNVSEMENQDIIKVVLA